MMFTSALKSKLGFLKNIFSMSFDTQRAGMQN